jgi:predicted nucleotidyltransferase
MESTQLPEDFKEFLKLLNANHVEYLLIGGYAVSSYGYPRATAEMDVWIGMTPANALRVVQALRDFGYDTPELHPELFQKPDQIIRMGIPPLRLEILTTISGVNFPQCYPSRLQANIDGVCVSLINLKDLKANKRASARPKDLDDLDHLEKL